MKRFAMYDALLRQQWTFQRVEITALSLGAAAICPGCLWLVTNTSWQSVAQRLLEAAQPIGILGAIAAGACGLLLALRPFVLDGMTRHTYALSLPVPRARYALLRVGVGLTLAVIPTTAFLIGALVAVNAAPSADLIRVYPVQLAARFLLTTTLAFAITFSVQYGLGHRALRQVLIAMSTVLGVELLGQLFLHDSVTGPFWSFIGQSGSPLNLFASQWMLFNV